jgi:hypothetical protein
MMLVVMMGDGCDDGYDNGSCGGTEIPYLTMICAWYSCLIKHKSILR